MKKWRQLAIKSERNAREVKIALVGKYVALEDAYVSVVKALKHSALAVNRKLVLNFIDSENLQPRMQAWILKSRSHLLNRKIVYNPLKGR